MTKTDFEKLTYLEKKFYINNNLGLRFPALAKKHNKSESAIVQALQGKIPTLFAKIVNAKYMGLE